MTFKLHFDVCYKLAERMFVGVDDEVIHLVFEWEQFFARRASVSTSSHRHRWARIAYFAASEGGNVSQNVASSARKAAWTFGCHHSLHRE